MGLNDRDYMKDEKPIKNRNRHSKNNNAYTSEKPNTNGYVIPSLRNQKSIEDIPKPEKNTFSNPNSPPKVEDNYKKECVPISSPIQTQYNPANNKAPKVKKPWWKFW